MKKAPRRSSSRRKVGNGLLRLSRAARTLGSNLAEQHRLAQRASVQTRSFLDAGGFAFICVAGDGKIQEWNRSAEELFGYSAREARGMPAARLMPPGEQGSLQAVLAEVSRGGRLEHRQLNCVRRDGRKLRISFSAFPVRGMGGEVGKVSFLLHEQLGPLDRRRTAVGSRPSIEALTFAAAHDMQEPLRQILLFGQRLSSRYAGKLDAAGRDDLARIQKSAARMRRLMRDLVLYSEAAASGGERLPVDLGAAAREALEDLAGLVDETKGSVVIRPLPKVRADPAQVRTVFFSLLSNALKFHRADEAPRVVVSGRVTEDGWAEVDVADNGIGFEGRHLHQIFEPFRRLHAHDAYEGSGLGLAVCARIVAQHGGKIAARSSPGKGSTFTIRLPAVGD